MHSKEEDTAEMRHGRLPPRDRSLWRTLDSTPSTLPSVQIKVTLPPAPGGTKWRRVVDTNLASPKDFTPGGNNGVDPTYGVQAFSSIMLIAK